jgi:hypothetical protein
MKFSLIAIVASCALTTSAFAMNPSRTSKGITGINAPRLSLTDITGSNPPRLTDITGSNPPRLTDIAGSNPPRLTDITAVNPPRFQ